ncbi:glycosyltransferase [Tenacibaculum haliotis]|uniref:glycosyltransferase n=1 Tax=Tenacibaculum haliotis TaxID=1888914 RepID=UPI0021AF7576|nr:glycosyltransferase [Tenacibaculum haliotis]MCT4699397.1 glycosyltransferase [Tenacibaculum haliotis]
MKLNFSIIIPVYNRPQEIDELLESLTKQDFQETFEVVIIEDGSEKSSEEIVEKYESQLDLKYFYKENSGAGASRNYGMQQATGNYFIILDSDVIVPPQYVSEVKKALKNNFTDAFGGPDAAHKSFTDLQKAINYSMTSVLTTGGIRGKKKGVGKFQPRSFNLGLSEVAFSKTNGFSKMKTGEDIDLTFRLWKNGFETQLIEKAFVYHKRRSTIRQFFKQTYSFGTARPILNKKYPETAKITYWFPSLFIIGFDISILFAIFGYWQLVAFYGFYFTLLFIDTLIQNKNIKVAFLSIITSFTQFIGYGLGFLKSKFFAKK